MSQGSDTNNLANSILSDCLFFVLKSFMLFFAAVCILLIPINVSARAESTVCPSSSEAALKWKTPLLTQKDLTGELQFLSVPYPIRDIDLAKGALVHNTGLTTPADFKAAFSRFRLSEADKGTTEFSDFSNLHWSWLRSFYWGAHEPKGDHEEVYQFVVDEGCANLTVWRLGVFEKEEKITKLNLRRVYADNDFARRNIPFRYIDFDQAMRMKELSNDALTSLVQRARKEGMNEIAYITDVLLTAGARVSEGAYSRKDKSPSVRFFVYTPDYIAFDIDYISPWQVTADYNPETGSIEYIGGGLYGGIKSPP